MRNHRLGYRAAGIINTYYLKIADLKGLDGISHSGKQTALRDIAGVFVIAANGDKRFSAFAYTVLGGAKVSSADIIHYVAAHYHCIAFGGAPHKVNIMLERRYLTLFAERLTVFLREAGTNALPCGCLFFGESFFFRVG